MKTCDCLILSVCCEQPAFLRVREQVLGSKVASDRLVRGRSRLKRFTGFFPLVVMTPRSCDEWKTSFTFNWAPVFFQYIIKGLKKKKTSVKPKLAEEKLKNMRPSIIL